MTKLTDGNKVTHEEIARYAYLLWEEDGKPEGQDVEYWVKAETLLFASSAIAKPAAKPSRTVSKTTKAKKTNQDKKAGSTPKKAVKKAKAATKGKVDAEANPVTESPAKKTAAKNAAGRKPAAKKTPTKKATKKRSSKKPSGTA